MCYGTGFLKKKSGAGKEGGKERAFGLPVRSLTDRLKTRGMEKKKKTFACQIFPTWSALKTILPQGTKFKYPHEFKQIMIQHYSALTNSRTTSQSTILCCCSRKKSSFLRRAAKRTACQHAACLVIITGCAVTCWQGSGVHNKTLVWVGMNFTFLFFFVI